LWLVVGLGNPGRRYAKTRHNIGFMVADHLAERYGIELSAKRESYMAGKGSVEGSSIVLVEPLTFMNRSGLAARDAMKRYGAEAGSLIVVHDDIDMDAGKLKIRKRGSSGGHRGIESIIRETGTSEFIRVKIGIGREEGLAAEDHVLGKFTREEIPVIKDAITSAADAVVMIIARGVDKAMNTFN
jgi:PTH1 family peptidyl-tRNA hydrolase